MTKGDQRKQCPHYDQVRLVAFHHISAKGPVFARSLTKKALGNEEFCMQVDAHTEFVKGWDMLAVDEWKKTSNEFGVISTAPAAKSAKDTDPGKVPRQCRVKFLDNGFPVSSMLRELFVRLARMISLITISISLWNNRTLNHRQMDMSWDSPSPYFRMAGRLASLSPSVTCKKAFLTIPSSLMPCLSSSFRFMLACGPEGKSDSLSDIMLVGKSLSQRLHAFVV